MFEVIVKDLQGKQTNGAKFETFEAANEWIIKQQSKKLHFGRHFGEREMWKDEVSQEDLPLIINEEVREFTPSFEKPIYALDPEGNQILEDYTYTDEMTGEVLAGKRPVIDSYELIPAVNKPWVTLKPTYTVEVKDLSQDPIWIKEQRIEAAIKNGEKKKYDVEKLEKYLIGENLEGVYEVIKSKAPASLKGVINSQPPNVLSAEQKEDILHILKDFE